MDEELPKGFVVESMPQPTQPIENDELPEGFNVEPKMGVEQLPEQYQDPVQGAQPKMGLVADENGELVEVPLNDPNIQREAIAAEEAKITDQAVADLPDPEGIMEGLSTDDAVKLYGAYAKHPKSTRDEMGNVVYNGKPVQVPQKSGTELATDVVSEAATNVGGVGKGIANAGANVIETTLAGADMYNKATGADKTYGIDTSKGMAEKFREHVPELKGKNATEQFFVDLGEIGTGAVGGAGIGQAIGAASKLGAMSRAALTFLGGEGGTGITQSADNPLLVTGDDSLSEKLIGYSLPKLGTDANGNYSEELLTKRLALVEDALATGAAVGAAGSAVKKAGSMVLGATVDKIKNFLSLPTRQKQMVLDALDVAAGIDPKAQLTAAEKKPIRDAWLATLDDETRFKLESGNADLGDIDVNRTTLRAADEAGVSPESLTQLQDFEGSVRQKSQGPLDKADAQYGNVLHEGTEKMLKNEGGEVVEGIPENITKSSETVQAEARKESAPFHETADTAEQMHEGSTRALEEDIRRNRVIGDRATELEDAGPEALQKDFATKETNLEKINEEIKGKSKTLDNELKARTDAIPEGLRMNNPKDIAEEAQRLLVEKHASGDLVDKIHAAQINDVAGGLDYKKLTEAIKQLRKEKDRAFKSQNYEAGDALQRLDDLIKKGTPDADEIKEWDRFYKEEWAPVNRVDTSGRIRDLGKKEKSLGPATVRAEQKGEIKKSLESPDLTKQMADVLANPKTGSGSSQHLLDQAMIDDVTAEVADHVRKGGELSTVSPDLLSAGLQKRMAQINATNPEMGTELTTLFKRIKDGQIDIKKYGDEATTARSAQDAADQQIFGDKFKDFFTGGGSGKEFRESGDPLKAFDDVLKTGQSEKLKNVVAAVEKSGDPVAKRGLRAAYVRNLRERLFDVTKREKGAMDTRTGLASERPALRADESAKFTDGDPLYQAGLEIFKDEPEALKFIKDLVEEAAGTSKLKTNSGLGQTGANKASKEGATQGFGRIITWTLGVLNPVATRAKTISSAAIDAMNPEDDLAKFAEYILHDASNFSKEARKAMKSEEGNVLSAEMTRYLRKAIVKAGIRQVLPEDENYKARQEINKDKTKKRSLGEP